MTNSKQNLLIASFKTGIFVGIFDALAACLNSYIVSSVSPDKVFRFISSGLFGTKAFNGGPQMIVWGIVFHFITAIFWTSLFYWFRTKTKFLFSQIVISGMVYGVIIWLVMNFVALPLSQIPPIPFKLTSALTMISIHMFVIGVPIAYFEKRHHKIEM